MNDDKLKKVTTYFNDNLNNKIYRLVAYKNNKTLNLYIRFIEDNFKHLIWLHKLSDIEYYNISSSQLFENISNNIITYNDISNSLYFDEIEERIEFFSTISKILSDSKVILHRIRENSFKSINADYLLLIELSNGKIAELFLVIDSNGITTDDSVVVVPCTFFVANYNSYYRSTEHYIVKSIEEVNFILNFKEYISKKELIVMCRNIIKGITYSKSIIGKYFKYDNIDYYIKNIRVIKNIKLIATLVRVKDNVVFIDKDFAHKAPLKLHLKEYKVIKK